MSFRLPIDSLLPIVVFLLLLAPIGAMPVLAQSQTPAKEPDILRRLMAEPLTLFDWGLAQLDRDIARVGSEIFRHRPAIKSDTGTIYEWRHNRVTIFVAVALPPARRTRKSCTETFLQVRRELIRGSPSGQGAAGWYLYSAFKPKGHRWGNRFDDVGEKLLDRVRLEISLNAAAFAASRGDSFRVRCFGRLDAAPEDLTVRELS